MADILIAEDDESIREWVALALEKSGHRVRAVGNGAAALVAYAEQRPDVLVLDIMMPVKSGYDVCTEIRRTDHVLPILMLTAKSTEEDKVLGLSLGADDYLVKPFGLAELIARISALIRRASVARLPAADESFEFGSHRVDTARRKLIATDGSELELTQLELGVLRFLFAHQGEPVTRENMIVALWGNDYAGTNRTLDQRINLLRKKLGSDAACIETVFRTGYRYLKKK